MAANFSFKKGFNAELIIKEIKKGRIVQNDGRVSLAFPQHSESLPLLLSALVLGEEVGHKMANSVVTSALFSKALPKDFTTEDLSRACRRIYAQQLRRQASRFIAYFTFTLDGDPPASWIKAGGCRIYFNPAPRSPFFKIANAERQEVLKQPPVSRIAPSAPGKHMPVLVHVDAHSPFDAFYAARDAVDEVRGLLNFLLNSKTFANYSWGGTPKAVNKVLLGPHSSVHTPDGALADGAFWYSRDWEPPSKIPVLDERLRDGFRRWNKHMRKPHSLTADALVALRMYCRALDHREWEDAFLGLWITLEFLAHVERADYEKLVRRVSAMHGDTRWMRQVGQHLRVRRNEIIHRAVSTDDAEILIWQAKRFVEPLMFLYMRNHFGFTNRDEVAEFLDLPSSDAELARKLRIVRAGVEFRKK